MSVGLVVLVVLVTARLTRLVVLDRITESAVVGVINMLRWAPKVQRWFHDLVSCAWCTSMWIAPPVAALAWFFGDTGWFIVPAVALSSSWLVSVCGQWLDPGSRFSGD